MPGKSLRREGTKESYHVRDQKADKEGARASSEAFAEELIKKAHALPGFGGTARKIEQARNCDEKRHVVDKPGPPRPAAPRRKKQTKEKKKKGVTSPAGSSQLRPRKRRMYSRLQGQPRGQQKSRATAQKQRGTFGKKAASRSGY